MSDRNLSRLFTAEHLDAVLGLVAMCAVWGDDWQSQKGEWEINEPLVQATPPAPPRPK